MNVTLSASHTTEQLSVSFISICRFVKSKISFADTAEREPPPKGAGVTMLLYGTKVGN